MAMVSSVAQGTVTTVTLGMENLGESGVRGGGDPQPKRRRGMPLSREDVPQYGPVETIAMAGGGTVAILHRNILPTMAISRLESVWGSRLYGLYPYIDPKQRNSLGHVCAHPELVDDTPGNVQLFLTQFKNIFAGNDLTQHVRFCFDKKVIESIMNSDWGYTGPTLTSMKLVHDRVLFSEKMGRMIANGAMEKAMGYIINWVYRHSMEALDNSWLPEAFHQYCRKHDYRVTLGNVSNDNHRSGKHTMLRVILKMATNSTHHCFRKKCRKVEPDLRIRQRG